MCVYIEGKEATCRTHRIDLETIVIVINNGRLRSLVFVDDAKMGRTL